MASVVTTAHTTQTRTDTGVVTLTITSARSMNILSSAVIADVTRAITGLAADRTIRVLVLRGSGDKAFIGGADIFEMSELTPDTARTFISGLRNLCDAVRLFPAPVIARLSGWCLGGGLEVALAADLRLASSTAQFGMPEVHVGIPSVIHAVLLPRLIGSSRAAWMLMTGDTIDAEAALNWGLVHSVHAADSLDAAISRSAERLAGFGPLALRQQKRLLRSWEDADLTAAIDASVDEFASAFTTGEPQQYMAAFKARRRPKPD